MKSEVPIPKLEPSTLDVKEEVNEPETKELLPDILPEEIQGNRELPTHDSEDMSLDGSLRRKHSQQATPQIRVLRKEPQLQLPLGTD